jgi:hypothetical protein
LDFGERNKSCLITDYFSLTKKKNLFLKKNDIWGPLLSDLHTLCIVRFQSQCSVHDRRQLYNLCSNPCFTGSFALWFGSENDIISFRNIRISMDFILNEASKCDQLRNQVRKRNLLARINEHFFWVIVALYSLLVKWKKKCNE